MARCPEHPDVELLHVAGTYETGVVAPDGGKEYQWGEGFYCDYCNYTWDASDLSNKVPHVPSYVFREGIEPLAYQIWRSDESSGVIHESCAIDPTEREFPLYADDLSNAQNKEPIICETCDGLIVGESQA